jgi:hypothetical protein
MRRRPGVIPNSRKNREAGGSAARSETSGSPLDPDRRIGKGKRDMFELEWGDPLKAKVRRAIAKTVAENRVQLLAEREQKVNP